MDGLTGTKGGSGVWQRIISEMPEHDVYIEPFWGRGTIARKKRPARYTIGCDMDPAAISSGDGHADLMFRTDALQWLADYFRLPAPADLLTLDPAALEQRTIRLGDRPPLIPAAPADAAGNGNGRPSRNGAAPAAACTFGGVSRNRHLVYLDPPYCGVPNYYQHPFTTADHRVLCRLFLRLPCPAMLSGYRTRLYADELPGVRNFVIPTVNRAGRRVNEIVWCNFPPPIRYHDTRFCGVDRRERERIARRARTWSAVLARMPPAERQRVFEAVCAQYRNLEATPQENTTR